MPPLFLHSMKIIQPQKAYLPAYLEYCKHSWATALENYILHDPDLYNQWKDTIFDDFYKAKNNIDLDEGIVPWIAYWVIENEKVVAVINFRLYLNEFLKKYGGSVGILIDPNYRGQGICKKCMPFIFDEYKNLNIKDFMIATQETNTAAIKILDSHNPIKVEKEQVIHDGKPLDIRRYYFD